MNTHTNRPGRPRAAWQRTALALAIAACCSATLEASAANGSTAAVEVARVTRLAPGDVVTGALPMGQPLHVVVALKLRDREGLDARIAGNMRHREAPALLTPSQFLTSHAPTAQQAQAVADYLTRAGFRNVTIAPNRLLVSADGTAANARDAFMTTFAQVRTHDGRVAFANTDAVRIPAALDGTVLSVLGLQTVHMGHTFARKVDPAAARTMTAGPHDPLEFSSIYGGTGVATASGITIGIITNGSLTQVKTDLNAFTTAHGLAAVTTQVVNTDGTSSDTAGTLEWDLDSQSALGMGGGSVGKIIFYNIPALFDNQLTDDFNTAVNANVAKIINVSIGVCETDEKNDGAAAAQDQIFAVAVAQGQTFSVSTGDSGADECPSDGKSTPVPSWPASSQYVIAVGGTSLTATSTTWTGEAVWTGSGGSPSLFEPKPSWQGSTVTGTKRGTPDISFDGDPNTGALIRVSGGTSQVGGTSLSAPIFAGWWARVLATKGTTFGFAGPWIYGLPASALHDVTVGNNGGETAGVGYDFASGRGSPILATSLGVTVNNPPVAGFSFSSVRLTANFVDTSTDSDGTIASHAWTFGDGGTSTLANPSHAYAAAGTYSVTETVTDNGGATGSKTQSVKVATTAQLLFNTGFETGKASPWVISTGVLNNTAAQPAHFGTWDVWLDGKGIAQSQSIAQQVTVPAGWTTATLKFWMHVDTAETSATLQNDKLTVRVTDASNNVLATLGTFSNLNAAAGYVSHSFDVTPYMGQTIKVKFTGAENASLQTSFVLDDITLTLR